jgi:hypothetical protein
MTFPAPTRVGRLSLESRHMPAAQGGGGDIYDMMATPFGVRLLIGDVMRIPTRPAVRGPSRRRWRCARAQPPRAGYRCSTRLSRACAITPATG